MVRFIFALCALSLGSSAFFQNIEDKDLFSIPSDEDTIIRLGASAYGPKARFELPADEINLLVWNIYKGKKENFYSSYSKLAAGKDIVVLQEYFHNEKLKEKFIADESYYHILATSFKYKKERYPTGVMTGSLVNATSVDFQRSIGKETVGGTPKIILFTTYPIEGQKQELLVINIHGLNSVTKKKLTAQVTRALELANSHFGPVVFAGDFNTWSKGKLKMLDSKMKTFRFSAVKFSNDFRMTMFGNPLDHVFVRDIEYKEATVHTSPDIDGSDHKAMSLKLVPVFK